MRPQAGRRIAVPFASAPNEGRIFTPLRWCASWLAWGAYAAPAVPAGPRPHTMSCPEHADIPSARRVCSLEGSQILVTLRSVDAHAKAVNEAPSGCLPSLSSGGIR